uniref:Uncharacterized protein n=1 Tax=Manihot esculenta TaxID=3983 RepID=A0A2C9WAI0_MANES
MPWYSHRAGTALNLLCRCPIRNGEFGLLPYLSC